MSRMPTYPVKAEVSPGISAAEYKRRTKKLLRSIPAACSGILLTSPANIRYLSGFSGSEAALLVARSGSFFHTDGRYTSQARQQVTGASVITCTDKWKSIAASAERAAVSGLGYESAHMTVAAQLELAKLLPSCPLYPLDTELEGLRTVKNRREIALLKKAAAIAGESLREIMPIIRPGVRESEVAAELEHCMRSRGGTAGAFETIVASGHRSALPHGIASEKKLSAGELVVIDYGTVYEGYASDETCTFILGRPTRKQKRVYDAVLKAHDRALRTVKPGRLLRDIDAAARSYIAGQGFGKQFIHGTGHGIGLCVHEPPSVSFRSSHKAETGMVFTIEPGIYISGWGGVRIEDTVVVTKNGCEILTRSTKDLKSVCLS